MPFVYKIYLERKSGALPVWWSRDRFARVPGIVFAALGLILFAPLLAIVALAIRLESRGPVLLAQERVGRHGQTFTCYKLRTMFEGTPERPTHHVDKSSCTRVGVVLRKSSIDELPQLWNVLNGTMSLVGPRPSLPSQRELVEIRRNLGVLSVRPGITGLAQANRIDMSTPRRLANCDAEYVRNQSWALDGRIVIDTAVMIGKRVFGIA